MSYASLLVHVQDDDDSDARIRLAFSLAQRFDARLVGVAAAGDKPLAAGLAGLSAAGNALAAQRLQFIESGLRAAESRFRRITVSGSKRPEWCYRLEYPVDAVCLHAATADLVVVGRSEEAMRHAPYSAFDPADLIMCVGRPVVVVPPGMANLSGDRIVVAWKDTREGRRAVIDALPFLEAAAEVHVLEIARDENRLNAEQRVRDVASFLRLHNVKAMEDVRAHHRSETDAELLVHYAQQKQADLIVAGGYAHTRLREWVYGGVTWGLLHHSPICCLFSH